MDIHFHIPHWLLVGGATVIVTVVLTLAIAGAIFIRTFKNFCPFG